MTFPTSELREAEAANVGFAQQLSKALRKYFEGEIKKQELELKFLYERQKRLLKARTTAIEKAGKRAQKKIDKFL